MKHKTQIMRGLVVLLLAALMPIAAFAQGANYSLNKDFEGNVNAFFDALARGEPGDIFVVDRSTGSSNNPIDAAIDVSDGVTLQIDSFLGSVAKFMGQTVRIRQSRMRFFEAWTAGNGIFCLESEVFWTGIPCKVNHFVFFV